MQQKRKKEHPYSRDNRIKMTKHQSGLSQIGFHLFQFPRFSKSLHEAWIDHVINHRRKGSRKIVYHDSDAVEPKIDPSQKNENQNPVNTDENSPDDPANREREANPQ